MSRFRYTAFNNIGELQSGSLVASTKGDVLNLLNQKQLTLVKLQIENEVKEEIPKKKGQKINPNSIFIFTRQLHSLIKVGVPLAESMELIIGQSSDEKMQNIKNLHAQVREGKNFSDALRQYSQVFSELYINSIQIGEKSGNLEQVLENLLSQMENDSKIVKDLKKAMSYPIFLISALFLAFVVFITFVIPKFIPIFTKSGTELPMVTKILILISEIFNSYYHVILLSAAGLGLLFYAYSRSAKGKFMIHFYLLKIPLIGNLLKKVSSQRFCSNISTLIKHGIPLVDAMKIVIKTEANFVIREKIKTVRQKVENGESITSAMKSVNIFPKIMIHMISVGELTGTLEHMMEKVAEFNQSEISETIEKLTALIEPVITVLLAVMVLFLALSIFLPMWDMMGI